MECFGCNHSSRELDAEFERLIKEFGWAIVGVFDFPFAYTVGASDLGLPEIIVTGLRDVKGCTAIINHLLTRIKNGEDPVSEEYAYTEVSNFPCYLRKLTRSQMDDYMTVTIKRQVNFEGYQLVYPDPKGIFPWEEGYDFPKQKLLWKC